MIERVVIDVPTQQVVRLKMPPDQHRSTQCDDVSCFGGWEDVQWAKDGKSIAFVSTSRDHTQDLGAHGGCRHRRRARCVRREREELVRIRHQRHQLALPAGEQRAAVVEPAQQLGSPVSVRPRHRQGEAPGDGRRLERRRSAAPGPGVAHGVVHRRRTAKPATTRTTSTCTRRTSTAAHRCCSRRKTRSTRSSCRMTASTSSTRIRPPPCRRSPCCAMPTTARCSPKSRRPTSRA